VIDRRWNDVDVSDGRRGDPPIGDALAGNESSSIDELLDRAVAAIKRGDRMTANSLAQQVLTAPAPTPTQNRRRQTSAPPSILLAARARPYSNCGQHWTISSSVANPRRALVDDVSRFPADSAFPELARAEELLR
jgi:hypothetical protein